MECWRQKRAKRLVMRGSLRGFVLSGGSHSMSCTQPFSPAEATCWRGHMVLNFHTQKGRPFLPTRR